MRNHQVNYAHYYALLATLWAGFFLLAILAWMHFRTAGSLS